MNKAIGETIVTVDELDTQKIVYIKDKDEFVYAYKLVASTESELYLVFINAEDGTVMKYSRLFDCTSAEVVSEILGVKSPEIGDYVEAEFCNRVIKFYRMPSSSRAYPMKVDKKAEIYSVVFKTL